MKNYFYAFNESIEGIKRAKLSYMLSILVISFLLSLIGVLAIVTLNIERIISTVNADFDIQVFVSNIVTDDEIEALNSELSRIRGITKVDFYSKEAAAKEFQKEFGNEIFELLEENPLPSSFNVRVSDSIKTIDDVEKIAAEMELLYGVDQVVYHGQALDLLRKYSNIGKTVNVLLLIFVIIGSLLVVSNTLRLVIFSRSQIIRTMKLVGATRGFIRFPYVLDGLFQGGLGGLFALFFIYLLYKIVNSQVPGLLYISMTHFLLILVFGLCLGFLGSFIAIRRYLDEVS